MINNLYVNMPAVAANFRAFICFLAIWVFVGACAKVSAETYVDIEFTNESGEAVVPSSAELLLVAWGEAHRVPIALENDSNRLRVFLDKAWLASRWPERFADMEKAYLYFRAEGFASIRSEPFLWPGSHGAPYGPLVTSTQITLPNGENVQVRSDEAGELRVMFRRQESRHLRVLDTAGAPIEGVSVRAGMFWSSSNHCGVLNGYDVLAEVVSDEDGVVSVPDGDFEYALEFDKLNYVLAENRDNLFTPPRLVIHLRSPETVVKMRRLERQPLSLLVRGPDSPRSGLVLMGIAAGCGCGVCGGPLAITDARGEIRVADFYPGRYASIWLQDATGQHLWQADTGSLDFAGTVRIELGQ